MNGQHYQYHWLEDLYLVIHMQTWWEEVREDEGSSGLFSVVKQKLQFEQLYLRWT